MKFRTKILVCMVWVLALAIGISGTAMIQSSFSSALDREKLSAQHNYKMLTSALGVVAVNSSVTDLDQVYNTLDQFYASMDLASIKLEQDGKLLYSQGEYFFGNGDPEDGQCILWVHDVKSDTYLSICGWITIGESRMRLTLASSVGEIFEERDQTRQTFCWIYFAAVALGGLLSWILAHALTRPLAQVSAATQKMAQGDLSVRLTPKGTDEVAGLGRDFNHMARTLEENIQAMEDTMAAQERFMGSFAHELKTPMTSIIGYADLLRSQSLTETEAMDAANYIFSEGRRLESLSLKLLEILVAKNETVTLESTAVDQLISSLVSHLKPVYEKSGIQLSCQCQPGSWDLDPALIRSVLVNLLDNSRKAMDRGGTIHIILDFPGHDCRVRVTDTGRGMPPEAIAHLTEAFYRVDKSRSRAQGGAGLGLTLCQEIITLHGGQLLFASQPGKGTTVTVLLKGGRT